jgi:hypothetical protein
MNNIVPLRSGGMPAAFATSIDQGLGGAKALQEGLSSGFAVVKYKGSKWSITHRGETEVLTQDNGAPMPFLDVVILATSPNISKTYYDKRFSEGDNGGPDCFSLDGLRPDPQATSPQCSSCAACPKNVYGSRMSESGKKAKACQDNRILTLVPHGDIANEGYGGPMMLRVPPMSLANAAAYGRELGRFNADLHMVVTRIGFDYTVAFPLMTFQTLGWLDDAAARDVVAMREPGSDGRRMIDKILSTADHETGDATTASPLAQGGPPAAFAAPAAAVPPAAPAPASAPAQTAPAAPKAGSFGRKAAASVATAATAAAPVVVMAPAAPEPAPEPIAGTVQVTQAGPDLDDMIKGLLG